MAESKMAALVVCVLIAAVSATGERPPSNNEQFDNAFNEFLEENGYRGGAVAAMKDGRLLHARGYGRDRQGHDLTAHSHFQVSSLAKSLTAVAVMSLVQDGSLNLYDKVFGDEGLLYELVQPWRPDTVDERLYDITVEHLLRHGAGWDTNKAPLYDPVLNDMYLDRGHKVPNIARDMGLESVSSTALISYVMSQPLAFTPGTNVAYSNMAYVVLGRVVEQVSGMEYRDFVKRAILDPCGMWNTRLEMAYDRPDTSFGGDDPSIYDLLDPVAVDSALGWYSNVYDLMRFARCTFQQERILDKWHRQLLLEPLASAPTQHSDTWHCAGFRTNRRGALWQDADQHADDLVLYHNLHHDHVVPEEEDDNPEKHVPDTWVVLLHDKGINHIRHYSRELMGYLDTGEQLLTQENLFLYDLSDLHKHPMYQPWTRGSSPEYSIRYRLDEHHLSAYVAATKDESFNLMWYTSYSIDGHTYFLLVSRAMEKPQRGHEDYIFEHGLDHRTLLKHKLQMEDLGYNLTQLHSYRSMSHQTLEPTSFAAVFRPDAYTEDTQMKYGTGHLPEPYGKLVQMYHEKHFYPISQTVVFHDKDEHFSFIFVKKASDKERTDFKHHYDLTSKKLTKLTAEHGTDNLRLSYLNSYDVAGKFRFSAIVTNATQPRGLLEVEQPLERSMEITLSNLKDGLVPKYVVPYLNDDDDFKLAIYYEELRHYNN